MRLVMLLVGFALLTIPSTSAYADRDQVVRVQFLGWSATSADTYLIRIVDEDRGNRLEIREVGKPAPIVSVSTSPNTVRRVLESEQFANWSFTVEALKGLDAPNGWRLSGQSQGVGFTINLSNGNGSIALGTARLKPTGTGGYADAEISNAFWSADSKRAVIIVTHSKVGNWGLDVDEAYGFKLNSVGTPEETAKPEDSKSSSKKKAPKKAKK